MNSMSQVCNRYDCDNPSIKVFCQEHLTNPKLEVVKLTKGRIPIVRSL